MLHGCAPCSSAAAVWLCCPTIRSAWEELIERCEEAGVDAFEINFSCPHGMPERKMGMAMGQDCELLGEVCQWINAKATKPVWAKMTPNITDITQPAKVALAAGERGSGGGGAAEEYAA
jgi:dihydropyrimidine dehydrogenase (NADP+)